MRKLFCLFSLKVTMTKVHAHCHGEKKVLSAIHILQKRHRNTLQHRRRLLPVNRYSVFSDNLMVADRNRLMYAFRVACIHVCAQERFFFFC